MKILASEKLSSHKYKTPEGYLICTDAILARTGKQDYMRRELFGDSCENPDEVIWVDRKPEEVFDESTLSSFENKPITVEHPDEDVNPSNYKELAVGYVRDVRRDKLEDGTEVIKGNLVITDEQTIEEILNGEHTDLSCGYDCEILDEDNPQQRRIRGNHVALCEEGRAGVARIIDSKMKDKKYYIVKNGKYMLTSGNFANWGHKNILSFFTVESAEKYGQRFLGRGDWEIEMKDSKVEDSDEWTIKNTGLAYEGWNGRKLIKKFTTKKQAIEWIQSRFPEDKIVEDSKMKDKHELLENIDRLKEVSGVENYTIKEGKNKNNGHRITQYVFNRANLIVYDKNEDEIIALIENGKTKINKLHDSIIEDSKVNDSYIEISKDEIDDEDELEKDCSNLRLECNDQGKYYGIRGAKKDIWKLLAMYNMNEKKKYIEDIKIKDMAHFDMSEDDWDEITNNGDDESWIVNHYDISIKRERGRVKVAATGSRTDLEKFYKDYHLRDYGVKIIDSKIEDDNLQNDDYSTKEIKEAVKKLLKQKPFLSYKEALQKVKENIKNGNYLLDSEIEDSKKSLHWSDTIKIIKIIKDIKKTKK